MNKLLALALFLIVGAYVVSKRANDMLLAWSALLLVLGAIGFVFWALYRVGVFHL